MHRPKSVKSKHSLPAAPSHLVAGWTLLLCLLTVSCSHETATPEPEPQAAAQSLQEKLTNCASWTRHPTNQTLVELTIANPCESMDATAESSSLQQPQKPDEQASKFLIALEEQLGLDSVQDELKVRRVQNSSLGSLVRFDQSYQGLAVWPAELSVQLNNDQQLLGIRGDYVPTPSALSLTPKLSADTAIDRAIESIDNISAPCPNCKAKLAIYVLDSREPRLAFDVAAAANQINAWQIFVDASDGSILFKQPTAYSTGAH